MAAIQDPDIRLPPKLLDTPEFACRKPIGMNGAIENAEREIRDA
jgi:hypothetical protein